MAVPDYQTMMLPLLQLAADGEEHRLRDAIEELGDHFGLGDDERKELLPSGRQAKLDNRVGWARTYMKKAGLLESPQRGYFRITAAGTEALKQKPEAIDVKFLEQYQGFLVGDAVGGDHPPKWLDRLKQAQGSNGTGHRVSRAAPGRRPVRCRRWPR